MQRIDAKKINSKQILASQDAQDAQDFTEGTAAAGEVGISAEADDPVKSGMKRRRINLGDGKVRAPQEQRGKLCGEGRARLSIAEAGAGVQPR